MTRGENDITVEVANTVVNMNTHSVCATSTSIKNVIVVAYRRDKHLIRTTL